MADEDPKKPGFDPKPVQVGGESILDRILPYKKQIIITIVLGFMVWGVIATVFWLRDRKQVKATEKLAAVLDIADQAVRAPGEAADPKKPSFADAKERANAVLAQLAKGGADQAGAAYRASMLVAAGKLDEAIAAYHEGEKLPGLDGVLAREGLALALEAKAQAEKDPAAQQKGLEAALAAFVAMQPDDKGPLRAEALYHQGRILMQLHKNPEAKAALEKAKAAAKDPELPELVDERLAMLGASGA